jgi:hypothetical protein
MVLSQSGLARQIVRLQPPGKIALDGDVHSTTKGQGKPCFRDVPRFNDGRRRQDATGTVRSIRVMSMCSPPTRNCAKGLILPARWENCGPKRKLWIFGCASQIAGAGKALPGREIVAEDAEHNLRDQLFADRDFTAAGKPELHGGNILPEPPCNSVW